MASFGSYIKTEREKHGWTQTEFGAKIGINAFAICKIENGTQKFSVAKLKILSDVFETDLSKIKDMFFADKFAREAYQNKCSENVFALSQETFEHLRNKNIKQGEIIF